MNNGSDIYIYKFSKDDTPMSEILHPKLYSFILLDNVGHRKFRSIMVCIN